MSIRIIASEKNWIESSAVEQLKQVAHLPGMLEAVAMPDLHPGKGAPVGAVFASEKIIYPHLVGSDVGCGMGLWQTNLEKGRIKPGKLAERLKKMDSGSSWDSGAGEIANMAPTEFDSALGTIGGGNHFAELQCVSEVFDRDFFDQSKLDHQSLFLLVHSGSRGLGQQIYYKHCKNHGTGGLSEGSAEADSYLASHDHAVSWAKQNRKVIAVRICQALRMEAEPVLDVSHNFVAPANLDGVPCWFHRKGAAPSDRGPIVIPGSRGTLSYLVAAVGEQRQNLATLAHGAGRKWIRADCRGRLEKKYSLQDMQRTTLGGYVICADKNLLYEEAPQAYKDIDVVVHDLIDAGVIRLLAALAPVITYKTTRTGREQNDREKAREREMERERDRAGKGN